MKFKRFEKIINALSRQDCIDEDTRIMISNIEDKSQSIIATYHEHSNVINISPSQSDRDEFQKIGKKEDIFSPF